MLWVQVLPQLVTTQKQLARAISLSKQTDRVAVDCEGCQLSHEGRLCLVQVRLHASAIMAYHGCMLMTPHMLHIASAFIAWSTRRSKECNLLLGGMLNFSKISTTVFRSSNFMHSTYAGGNKLSCSGADLTLCHPLLTQSCSTAGIDSCKSKRGPGQQSIQPVLPV